DGSGSFSPLSSVTSWAHQLAITPGLAAVWSARWPSDIDFGCGFQVNWSCGTRSSTRRVVFASFSNSCSIAAVIDIGLPSIAAERTPNHTTGVQSLVVGRWAQSFVVGPDLRPRTMPNDLRLP